jgi:hypothetical protein
VPTKGEIERMEEYGQEVARERKELTPLMEALRGSAEALARVASNPREEDQVRRLAFGALEQMGQAHEKLVLRQLSVPVTSPGKDGGGVPADGPRQAQYAPAQDERRLPGNDPLLEGLRTAGQMLVGRVEAGESVSLAAIDALETLGPYGRPAVPAVNRVLTNPSPFVRRSAARVLGRIGPVEGVNTTPRLAWLMEFDPDLDVRLAAVTALDRYGPSASEAVPAAARTIQGRNDAEIRIAAIQVLRSIGPASGKKAVPALAAALSDPDVRIRREAAQTLNRFGPDAAEARNALDRAVNDSDLEVSRLASSALLQIVAPPAGKSPQ